MSSFVYNNNIYLRLRVTDGNGRQATRFLTVYVSSANLRLASANKPSTLFTEVNLAEEEAHSTLFLKDAHPNPATEATVISFFLPEANLVTLEILDVNGQVVTHLTTGTFEKGMHALEIGRNTLSKGLYFYRLTTQVAVLSKRLIIE